MKETKERKMIRHKKKNVRIFPLYKTVSWDLLFYFPIIFLFLTQIKGFSASQVLFADAFYTLANTFWQLPVTSLVDRIGKKNCLIIGNVLYSASILAMIFMQNYYELLLIQFIYALGYSIKGICESNILYDSLPASKKRGRVFATIDRKIIIIFLFVWCNIICDCGIYICNKWIYSNGTMFLMLCSFYYYIIQI